MRPGLGSVAMIPPPPVTARCVVLQVVAALSPHPEFLSPAALFEATERLVDGRSRSASCPLISLTNC